MALARAEPAIEPDLPIVDAHLHFWHGRGRTYLVADYARDHAAAGHRVEATVFVECSTMYRAGGPEAMRPVGKTEFAVGMAAMGASGTYVPCETAAAIVGHADLTLGTAMRPVLEAHVAAANGRFRGVRHRANWGEDPDVRGSLSADVPGLYLEPSFGAGLEMLAELGLSFDASVFHPQLVDVVALARAHPRASIVLNHCGSPVTRGRYQGQDGDVHARWTAAMTDLARCPNVSVKLGGLLMCLGSYDPARAEAPPTSLRLAELWRPWIEPCIELFGAERCMASSNFTVDRAGFGYGTLWNAMKMMTAGCSAPEKAALFAGTATQVYRVARRAATDQGASA